MEQATKTETAQTLRCPVCGMEFPTQGTLDEHHADQHDQKEKN